MASPQTSAAAPDQQQCIAPTPSQQPPIDPLDQYNPQSLSQQQALSLSQSNLTNNRGPAHPQQEQQYIDYSSYHTTPLYSHSYSYDPSYLTAHHPNNAISGGYMGLHQQSGLQHQQSTASLGMESVNGTYYSPLDQYSRVQSVGDIKMATQQFEATRHGVSMSQPDLSSATWPTQTEETKYQVL